MRTERDNTGRLRVAKGDQSGLGGQYAPDMVKARQVRSQMLNDFVEPEPVQKTLWQQHYPSFLMAGGGVAAALPGAYAGVFNGLSFLGITLVAASLVVLGIRENQ